jgi:hypothetical protein
LICASWHITLPLHVSYIHTCLSRIWRIKQKLVTWRKWIDIYYRAILNNGFRLYAQWREKQLHVLPVWQVDLHTLWSLFLYRYCTVMVIISCRSVSIYRLLLVSNYRIPSITCWFLHTLDMGVRIPLGVWMCYGVLFGTGKNI